MYDVDVLKINFIEDDEILTNKQKRLSYLPIISTTFLLFQTQ